MARSVRLLRSAVVTGGWSNFAIFPQEWTEIERAYGHALDPATRRDILRATTSFVLSEPFERAAAPSAEAEKRGQAIKQATEAFYRALFARPNKVGATFAEDAIGRHFEGGMPQLHASLLLFRDACNSALAELKASPGHCEGAAWDQWVRELTTILKAAGLPVAASKGREKSKSDSPSAFVSFVLKLQDCILKDVRCHNTPDGLATAINRARKGLRVKT